MEESTTEPVKSNLVDYTSSEDEAAQQTRSTDRQPDPEEHYNHLEELD